MAFPQVPTSNGGVDSTGLTTSHTVNLPASIAADDLILAYFTCDGDPTITWPDASWVSIGVLDAGGTGNSGQVRYRIADGTEGASITVTTSVAENSAHQTYRITGWHGTTAPEFASSSWGSTANPNPPSLTPSWGAEDTLWFASVEINSGEVSISVFPANYGNGVTRDSTGGFSGTTLGVSRRELNATSDDPGTFTISASHFCAAHTLAVRPGTAGGGSGGTGQVRSIATPIGLGVFRA